MWWDRSIRQFKKLRGKGVAVPFATQAKLPSEMGTSQAPDPTDAEPLGEAVEPPEESTPLPEPDPVDEGTESQPYPQEEESAESKVEQALQEAIQNKVEDTLNSVIREKASDPESDAPAADSPEPVDPPEQAEIELPTAPQTPKLEDDPSRGDLDGDGYVEDGDGDGEADDPDEFDEFPDGHVNLHEGCRCYIHRMMGGRRRWEANPGACAQCMQMMRAFNAAQDAKNN
jgi:hypothetical protein